VRPIFAAIANQSAKPSWDTLSTTLWALRPDDYMPIKIGYLRGLAKELGIDLPTGRPTPESFHAARAFCEAFRAALKPWHPQDSVDVQSFIWVVCPGKEKRQTRYWMWAPGERGRHWDEFRQA